MEGRLNPFASRRQPRPSRPPAPSRAVPVRPGLGASLPGPGRAMPRDKLPLLLVMVQGREPRIVFLFVYYLFLFYFYLV